MKLGNKALSSKFLRFHLCNSKTKSYKERIEAGFVPLSLSLETLSSPRSTMAAQTDEDPSPPLQQEDEEPPSPNLPPSTPTYPPPPYPVTVIGPQYCTPHPMVLTIQKKLFKLGEGIPLVNMRHKMITAHRRWDVYRGESSAAPMFSIKKSSLIQFKTTNLEVFLQSNTSEKTCDFKMKGSCQERSCVVTLAESKSIIAQMNKEDNTFSVTIHPNVDYAFIVALIVVSYEVNKDKKGEVNIDKKGGD
ncbi:hypothetical protein ACHQM5_016996 [Ranunculus cassubicifolius]